MQPQKKRAILIGVQLPKMETEAHEASLTELRRLTDTLGYEVVDVVSQKRQSIDAATVIGRGKLKELSEWTPGDGSVPSQVPKHRLRKPDPLDMLRGEEEGEDKPDETQAPEPLALVQEDEPEEPVFVEEEEEEDESTKYVDLLIFNRELTPTQLRNLEQATDTEILDRNGVIIEIFHRHAKTREARLQIEIAQLQYMAPRLRMTRNRGSDRQAGGVGAKGAGETQGELDKRRVRDRIAELKQQLEAIAKEDAQRRERRNEATSVALIGYTNAGKSSLMRRLTSDTTYVADKLFATLGTTVRVMQPETTPRVLISDTVGFINELPHELVASFRSTLDEARFASLVLHVVDASDPNFRTQIQVSLDVISDLKTLDVPRKLVLNKIDMLDLKEIDALRHEYPEAIFISAHLPTDVERVQQEIIAFLERDMLEYVLHIPYTEGKWTGEVHKRFRVLQTEHDAEGTWMLVRGEATALEALYDAETSPFLIDASDSEGNPFGATEDEELA